jgi:DNA-binding CsgD family transcriptional regulator
LKELDGEFALTLITAFGTSNNAHEFCKQLVHKVMRKHGATGALLGLVGSDSKCHTVGRFGEWEIENGTTFDLQRNSPVAQILRTGKLLLIESGRALQTSFPETDSFLPGAQSYVYAPFESTSRAVGFLGIGFANELGQGKVNHFEFTMASVVAEYVSIASTRIPLASSSNSHARGALMTSPTSLTSRQLEILQQMSEGRTNIEIGRTLNLSESSIKQESVKIFRALAVSNRAEASEAALRDGLI